MRTLGHRKKYHITFSASATLLAEGARLNDEIHQLSTNNQTFIPKGVSRFKFFDESNLNDKKDEQKRNTKNND